MKCPACDFEIESVTKFCPECGTKISNEEVASPHTSSEECQETVNIEKKPKKKLKKFLIIFISILITCGIIFSAIYLWDPFHIFPVMQPFENAPSVCVSNDEHIDLQKKIDAIGNYPQRYVKSSYSELSDLYQVGKKHSSKCGCELNYNYMLETMLYGEWKNSDGYYIKYTFVFEDWNNSYGRPTFDTNLVESKNNEYSYDVYVEGDKIVVAYNYTTNFIITFNENSISVENKNDNKTYVLSLNVNYVKFQEGNFEMAINYIHNNVYSFKMPTTVEVVQCYVDQAKGIVYATIIADNDFGGRTEASYKMYKAYDQYFITEFSHGYGYSNVDVAELNSTLQFNVSARG